MIINHQEREIEFEDSPNWVSLVPFCDSAKEKSEKLIAERPIMPTAPETASLIHGILIEGKSLLGLSGDYSGSVSDLFLKGYPIYQNTMVIYDFREEKAQGYDLYFLDMPDITHFKDFSRKVRERKIIDFSSLEHILTGASRFKVGKNTIFTSKDRKLRFIPALDKVGKIGDDWGWRGGEDPRDPVHLPLLVGMYMGRKGHELENVEKLRELYHQYRLFLLPRFNIWGDLGLMKEETKKENKGKDGFGIYQSCIIIPTNCYGGDVAVVRNGYYSLGRFIRIINRKSPSIAYKQ